MPDPQTKANVEPALAVTLGYNVSNGITEPYNSLTPVEIANFRTFEFRHTKVGTQDRGFPGGVNEAPTPFTTKNKNGKEHVFANYSTNSALLSDYVMGLLTFTGSDIDPVDGVPWISMEALSRALRYHVRIGTLRCGRRAPNLFPAVTTCR